ncbi:MAG: hypothetical protein ACJAVK_003083 [Akkermansiaceae bacterium]
MQISIFATGTLIATSILTAAELVNLAGDWSLTEFATPSRLRETYYNTVTEETRTSLDSLEFAQTNEILVDVFYPDPASVTSRSFVLDIEGVATGGETGEVLRVSNNRLVYYDGEDLSNLYTNSTGDVILANSGEEDQQVLSIGLRQPTSLVAADIVGGWTLLSMISPNDISKNVIDDRLVDVFFRQDPSISKIAVEIAAGGALSLDGEVSGTFSIEGNSGSAQLGPQTIAFQLNASRNVMTGRVADDDEEEILVLVKTPSTLATADLQGTWSLSTFRMPSVLSETYYNTTTMGNRQGDSDDFAGPNEILVDMFHPTSFKTQRYELQVSSSGAFTGVDSGGTMTGNPDGTVTVDVDGDLTFYPNADKNFMIGQTAGEDDLEFLVMIKTSDSIITDLEEKADLVSIKRPGSGLVLNWNAGEGLILEESSALDPALWVESPEGSANGSALIETSSAPRRFFRIAEKIEE